MNLRKLFISYTRNLFINTPEKPAYKVIISFCLIFTVALFMIMLTNSAFFGFLFAVAGSIIICAYHKPEKRVKTIQSQ